MPPLNEASENPMEGTTVHLGQSTILFLPASVKFYITLLKGSKKSSLVENRKLSPRRDSSVSRQTETLKWVGPKAITENPGEEMWGLGLSDKRCWGLSSRAAQDSGSHFPGQQ